MKIRKQLLGTYVQLEIEADTRQEIIDWRNYYWNWAAIKIGNISFDYGEYLDSQEKDIDEYANCYRIRFFSTKKSILKAYQASAEVKVNWEKFTEKKGCRARKDLHKRIERAALKRFERIPICEIS